MGLFLKPSQLRKARKLPDGTIRNWKGGKYKKVAGKWQPYSEGGKKGKPTNVQARADTTYTLGRVWEYQNDAFRRNITKLAKEKEMKPKAYFEKVYMPAKGVGKAAASSLEGAKKTLQKNPVSIFVLEAEDDEDAKETYGASDEQVAALKTMADHVKIKTENGDIPEGMKYFRLSTSDGYPILTVSDIKGFEEMFDWSV